MGNLNNQITGVVVTYNTKELIKQAYESIRKHHPKLKIIIVDGSEEKNPCSQYIKTLENSNTTILQINYNIGHGRGMCMGLYYVETPYVLFFDSDIVMIKSPISRMLKMFEEDTFGVGFVSKTKFDGFDYTSNSREKWMPYLHPYFQLVNVENYKKYYPYIHHGAPCVLTMLDIYKKGVSNKILKEFSGLKEYIKHDWAGTRKICKNTNKREIEGEWELNGGRI